MSTLSKLEALITIPSGTWTATFTDSGGTDTITFTAGNTYYHSAAGNDSVDLPAKIAALLNASGTLSGTYTCTVSSTTGKYTIGCDESFSASWPGASGTELRDLIGFNADIEPTTSATGANHAQGLWLPGVPADTPYGLTSTGRPVSTSRVSVSTDGLLQRWDGSKFIRNEYVWDPVPIAKAIKASEATTNESFETFWTDCVISGRQWAHGGRSVRYYADATVDGTSIQYHILGGGMPDLTRTYQGDDTFWTVRLDVVAA